MSQHKKLIDLLCDALSNAIDSGCKGHCIFQPCSPVVVMAEWLLENGVTIQEAAEWEETSRTEFKYDTEIEEKCSACGRHVERYETQPQDEYCPSCGRKMVLPEQQKEG